MSTTRPTRGELELRRLPATARKAMAEKAAERRSVELARTQFSRTFADVLSGRFGGRWSVEWERAGRSSLPSDRDGQPFVGEE
jgi:hypothetical protein